MADGFLLDRDSVSALARLLRERGITTPPPDRNLVDSWPTCHPARVTKAITARDEDKPGEGKIKLLVSDQVTGDAETQNIKLIAGADTEEVSVYRISKASTEIPKDTEGYVIQDRTGKLWWIESEAAVGDRIRGIVYQDFDVGDEFIYLTDCVSITGGELPDEPVEVRNVMKFFGQEGNVCKAELKKADPDFPSYPPPESGIPEDEEFWEVYAIQPNIRTACPGDGLSDEPDGFDYGYGS